jgi:hypothetical protein
MISVTTALIGLATYFSTVFVFALLWRGLEASQKLRKAEAQGGQQFSSQSAQTGEYARLT